MVRWRYKTRHLSHVPLPGIFIEQPNRQFDSKPRRFELITLMAMRIEISQHLGKLALSWLWCLNRCVRVHIPPFEQGTSRRTAFGAPGTHIIND